MKRHVRKPWKLHNQRRPVACGNVVPQYQPLLSHLFTVELLIYLFSFHVNRVKLALSSIRHFSKFAGKHGAAFQFPFWALCSLPCGACKPPSCFQSALGLRFTAGLGCGEQAARARCPGATEGLSDTRNKDCSTTCASAELLDKAVPSELLFMSP